MRRASIAVALCALLLASCADDPPEPAESVGQIARIGPRTMDAAREMMVIIDSIVDSDDDIRVRMRIVNLGEEPFDVGAEDTFYAPLIVLVDDLGNSYPGVAVEPAGIDGRSVGHFDLRVDGPLDPDASQFTVEVTTIRGPIATPPAPAPVGDAAQWLVETHAVAMSTEADDGDRSVTVLDVADLGTHVAVSVRVSDPSGLAMPDDLRATLRSADATSLEALPPTVSAGRHTALSAVLRFPGTLPFEAGPLTLSVAGVDVEIPDMGSPAERTGDDTAFADVARLPELIHARIDVEPLPTSTASAAE